MRKISDRNVFPRFDVYEEYRKLHSLFAEERTFIYQYISNRTSSYEDCLRTFFLGWELRGSFISLDEMIRELAIGEDHFKNYPSEERLLDYVQFIYNAIWFVMRKGELTSTAVEIGEAIYDNMCLILEHLNAEIKQEGEEFFVKHKGEVESVLEKTNPEIAASLVDYLKIDQDGDINRKREILCSLSNKLEQIRCIKQNFPSLYNDTNLLLNKAGIRHALNQKDKLEHYFMGIDAHELEVWYDLTFRMILACFAVKPYSLMKNELDELKALGK